MNVEIKRKWVEALRSGKFTQLRGGFQDGKNHCCLAVLGATISSNTPFPDDNKIGLSARERTNLIRMNDDQGKSFAEIADYIEEHL